MNYLTNYSPFGSIYTGLRSFIFAQIYPAPSIVNRGTRIFIGVQQLSIAVANQHKNCHFVKFDAAGNVHKTDPEEMLVEGSFEAVFIADSDNFSNHTKKYLICLGGNTTCFQLLIPEMLEIHKTHGSDLILIGFNPPGVGMSPGHTADLDHYCGILRIVINNLINHGIPCTNIMVMGHSLGGGIAAHVVAEYQQQNQRINLFVDRTMLSIADAVGIRIRNGIPTALFRNTLGYVLFILAKILIQFLKLDLNVATDFNTINQITPGAAHGMMAHEDEMLRDCGLANGLPNALPYFQQFKIKGTDQYRRSHSMVRSKLISVDGDRTADQFFHAVIEGFKKSKLNSY